MTKQPIPHYLNRAWIYVPAASHADSDAFRQRQRERLAQAQKAQQRAQELANVCLRG